MLRRITKLIETLPFNLENAVSKGNTLYLHYIGGRRILKSVFPELVELLEELGRIQSDLALMAQDFEDLEKSNDALHKELGDRVDEHELALGELQRKLDNMADEFNQYLQERPPTKKWLKENNFSTTKALGSFTVEDLGLDT